MAGRKESVPEDRRLKYRKKRVYLVIMVLMLLILAVVAIVLLHSANDRRTAEYLQKARDSYETGDYENALLYLRRADTDESNTEVLLLMADCYEAMGNYPRALEILRRMNTADPVISGRIQAIEQRKLQEAQKQHILIGGMELESDTQSVVLDGMGLTNTDVQALTVLYALDKLSLRENELTDIAFLSEFKGLDELDLTGNHIRNITPLSELSSLRVLNLDGNPVENCDALRMLRYLTSLSLVDTEISDEAIWALADVLQDCAIRFGTKGEEQVLLAGNVYPMNTTELTLREKGLTDISILQSFAELKILDLSDNEIADLRPLMGLSKLEKLNIDDNLVSDLRPLIGLPLLSKLEAENNLIQETTSVGSIEKLTDLDLHGNPIRDYSGLGRLQALKILDLTNTGITDADLAELYGLKGAVSIDLRDNTGLSDKAIGALKSALPGCGIATSELVYEINLSGHLVRSDEVKLAFPKGEITDLSGLAKMTHLEELDLSDNQIVSLYPFEITPSRTTIRKLNLANNLITDVQSLYALSGIEELDLSGNQIVLLTNLRKLTTLKRLCLTGNPITEDAIRNLHESIPDCEIIY